MPLLPLPPPAGTVSYTVLGAHIPKRPLVLIMGLSGVKEDWGSFAYAMAETRPVVVHDHRDIGASRADSPDVEVTLQTLAEDVVRLVEHLRFEEVDILGFSLGGVILQHLLLHVPHPSFSIPHAILAATTTKPPHGDPSFAALLARPPPARDATTEQRREFVKPNMELQFDAEYVDAHPEEIEKLVTATLSTRRPARTIAKQRFALRTFDHRPHLPLLSRSHPTTQVLVIHGALDRVIYPSEAAYFDRLLPHAQRLEMPSDQYGHWWFAYFGVETWVRNIGESLDREGEKAKL